MRPLTIASLATFILLLLHSSALANWSIGANLGYSFIDYIGNSYDQTIVSAPSSTQGEATLQPGLRIGVNPWHTHHEFYLDTGYSLFQAGGYDSQTLNSTGNYQFSANPTGPTSAYLTVGAGAVWSRFQYSPPTIITTPHSGTSFVYGAGIGVWHRIADDHGRIRAEVHFDRVGNADDGEVNVIDEAQLINVRLGFDLWMK
jgi:hypothetical protein